jgi:hypothetical protein
MFLSDLPLRSRSVTLSLIGGIRGILLKNIAYNLVIADSYQIIELKTSSDQWKLFKGDDGATTFL